MYSQSAQMVLAFLLWGVWVGGAATPGIITAIAFAGGIASGLNLPTWQSFVPQLVAREELVDAVRLNSMQFMGARAVGPAVAGLVLQAFGPGAAFMGNALSFLVVLAVLPWIHPRAVVTDSHPGRVLAHFREGLRYVGERRGLVLCMVLATSISAVGTSLVQLAPALANDEFGVGRGAYGLLVASFGAGAIAGAVVVAFQADRISRAAAVGIGWTVHIGSVLLLGFAPSYGVGVIALVGMGASYFLLSTAVTTSMQFRVSEAQRGRVLSIYFATMLTGLPVGALVQGKLADVFGLREVVVGSAVVLAGLFVVLRWRFDGLAPLDEPAEPDADR
jgi:MFS family permease